MILVGWFGVEMKKVPVLCGILGLLKDQIHRTGRHFPGADYRSLVDDCDRGRSGCRVACRIEVAG
jgi:hypothetical protein